VAEGHRHPLVSLSAKIVTNTFRCGNSAWPMSDAAFIKGPTFSAEGRFLTLSPLCSQHVLKMFLKFSMYALKMFPIAPQLVP